MKKVIGIMPLYDKERDSYWMLPGYMKMLEEAGAIPVMLPLTDNPELLDYFIESCGGFLLTGGQDVSPSYYGEEKRSVCGECCEKRDSMDGYILKRAVELDKPVLGICRGIQLMNAALGGTLYQDLPLELGDSVGHHMSPPYDRAAHTVNIIKNSPLYEILGTEKIGVNSCHHQGIKELSPFLRPAATAEDGLTEAAYMPWKRFVLGVQWHPEFSYKTDENSRKIVRAFIKALE